MELQESQLSKARPGRRMFKGNDREELEGGKQGDGCFLRKLEATIGENQGENH